MARALFFFFFFLILASPVPAADTFSRLDANNDGKVDWEEFSVALPNMKRAAFDTIDTDKDGLVSRAEWDAFAANHGHKKMGRDAPEAPRSGANGAMPLIEPPRK